MNVNTAIKKWLYEFRAKYLKNRLTELNIDLKNKELLLVLVKLWRLIDILKNQKKILKIILIKLT